MGREYQGSAEQRTRRTHEPAPGSQRLDRPVPTPATPLADQGAGLAPHVLSPAGLLVLQRTIGNAAVNHLLREAYPQALHAPATTIQRNGSSLLQSVGGVALDLAGQDVTRAPIFAAVLPEYGYREVRRISLDLPEAFTSAERAEMTLQFIVRAGRTTELARYALGKCPEDNGAFLDLMTFLHHLPEAVHDEPLPLPRLDLIATYRADLRNNAEALRRVVTIVKGAESIEAARRFIELFKDFNYDPAFAMVAIVGAEGHAQDVREERLRAIAEEEETQSKAAIDARRQEAIDSLTRSERTQLAKSLGLETLEPKVKAKQERLAAPKLASIEASAREQRRDVEVVQGPEAYAARREEYRQYYQAVAYHPAALGALEVAADDFAVARAIVAAIQAAPTTQALFVDLDPPLDRDARTRCLAVPAGEVGAILATITAEEFRPFAASDNRLALVRQVHAAGIPSARRTALVPRLAQYDAYCATATAVGQLTTLLQQDTPAEILNLLAAVPASGLTAAAKVGVLAALRPKALVAGDLLACLQLANRANWNATRLQTVLNAQPNGQGSAMLRGAIHAALAQQYNKQTEFRRWVDAIDLLVEEHYCTITFSAPIRLPHGSATDEVICTTSRPVDTFVIHKHLGAQQASVDNPNASKLHIKPIRGNAQTPRVYQESIPPAIRALMQGRI